MNIPPVHPVKASMKKSLLLLTLSLTALISVSCSIADRHYHPLTNRPDGNWQGSNSNWGGYTETRHSKDNYTIGFESYNNPNAEATAYFTLVRAAERAAIDGKRSFYLKDSSVKTSSQLSRFPGYVVPGYCETETIVHREVDSKGHMHYHTHRVHHHKPDTYVPPRKAKNAIHKTKRKLSYTKQLSSAYDTFQILNDASHNTRGYGKPKLDPRAKEQMKRWRKGLR